MTSAAFVINNDFITRQPKYVQRTIEARSRKDFCREKANIIQYFVIMCVLLP
jgi:hypothetical protein